MKKLTFESVLDKLRNYQFIISEYKSCLIAFEEIQPRVTTVFSHVDKSKSRNPITETERVVNKRFFLIEHLNSIEEQAEQKINEINDLIQLAEPYKYQVMLIIRYVYDKTIEQTAEIMNCSSKTITNGTKQAIKSIVKNYNKNMC